MEFVRRRRILRSSCPRDVELFLLFFLLLFFVRFSNCSTSIRSYPKLTSLHTRREDVGERTRHFPSRSDAIRANNKETRKLDPEIIQDFSTFIERIGSDGALFFEELAEWQFEAYNIWSTLPPPEMAQYRRG